MPAGTVTLIFRACDVRPASPAGRTWVRDRHTLTTTCGAGITGHELAENCLLDTADLTGTAAGRAPRWRLAILHARAMT